jgi:hypothetical protein
MDQFTGSEHWYRHALIPAITYIHGAKYVADACRAYWFLNEIALCSGSSKPLPPVRRWS